MLVVHVFVSAIHHNGCIHQYSDYYTTYRRMTSAVPSNGKPSYLPRACEKRSSWNETGCGWRRLTRWKQKGVKSAEVVYLNHAQKKCNYVYTPSISFKQEVQITLIPKIVVEINVIDWDKQGVLLTDDYS